MDRINELLGRLSELSSEELDELQGLILEEADSLEEQPTSPELVTTLSELAEASDTVKTEQTTRQEAEAQAETDRQAATDRINQIRSNAEDEPEATAETDDDEDDDKDKAEPQADAEGEGADQKVAVTAGGRVRRMAAQRGGSKPDANPEATPTDTVGQGVVLATGAMRGIDPSQPITSRWELAEAMGETLRRMDRKGAGRGDVVVASAHWEYPEERQLGDNASENARKIDAVVHPLALTASGGVCAPVNVDYAVPTWAVADRPLKTGLASFQATRGGLRYVKPPDQSALAEATSIWTEATDAAPGESSKPKLHIECGTEEVVYIDAIPTRLGFGNMQGQFAPEWVAANTDLAIAAAARVAENNLLKHLEEVCVKNVTNKEVNLGATRDFITQLEQTISAYRWIHRISPAATLTAVLPYWLKDILQVDLAKEQAHDVQGRDVLTVSHAEVDAIIKAHGINPIWHLDGQEEPGSKNYPLQGWSATAFKESTETPKFPSKIAWYVFLEGSIQFLDGGRLDLGVVRDSTLDATNDYETFIETFEGLAFRGFSSGALQMVTTLAASGYSSKTESNKYTP